MRNALEVIAIPVAIIAVLAGGVARRCLGGQADASSGV